MAITTLKAVRLKNAGLVDVFSKDRSHWQTAAKKAKEYVAEFVPVGEIHPDDLIPIMVPRLELDPKLRDHIEKKKLAQNRIAWFCEYVVDEVWSEI
jgi:hypothetical protein